MLAHDGAIGSKKVIQSTLFDEIGLMRRYDINGASYSGSETVIADLDENPEDATLYNSPLYSNVAGVDCLRFNDVAYAHTNGLTATNWTLDFWVRYYQSSTYYQRIWGMSSYRMEIALTNNLIYLYGGGGWTNTGINIAPYTEWHKLTFTYTHSPRLLTIYKNGVQVYSTTARGTTFANHWGRIGNSLDGYGAKVYIGEFNIYNKAQTAAQVLQNYNFNKAIYGR